MTDLKAGQNISLPEKAVRFTVSGGAEAEVSALVVNADLRAASSADFVAAANPAAPGLRVESVSSIAVDLSQLRPGAGTVLLLASTPAQRVLPPIAATISGAANTIAQFAISPMAGETAMICLELYQRQGGWKVRALGQGYAGGLTELLAAHGITAPPPPAPAAPAPVAPAAAAVGNSVVEPLHPGQELDRIWMIFEDAARSAAAFLSARDYAMKRLDDELSAAVSDPALRNSPAGEAARKKAQDRHDELVLTAETSHLRDSDQLARELAGIDPALPRPIASWKSPAWQQAGGGPGAGIRIGELYTSDRGPLRIPFCVPAPLRRPLWLVTESSAAAAPVASALIVRLLAIAPPGGTILDVIDQTSSLAVLTNRLTSVMSGPAVTEHSQITERLSAVANALELTELAMRSNSFSDNSPPPHRILVLSDFPHGYSEADVIQIAMIALNGGPGLSIIIIGADESGSQQTHLAALAQNSQHVSIDGSDPMFDPWTRNPWEFSADSLPADNAQLDQILRTLALPY